MEITKEISEAVFDGKIEAIQNVIGFIDNMLEKKAVEMSVPDHNEFQIMSCIERLTMLREIVLRKNVSAGGHA